MYRLVWEFAAAPGRIPEFEQVYSPQGRWANLFRRSPDFLGTELYRHTADSKRFIAVDVWRNRSAYENFRKQNAADYAALDAWCRQLLEHERMLGVTDDGKG